MKKDWKQWTVHINAHHLSNWAIGIDYYTIYEEYPLQALARVCQFNLLFFNITFTKWQGQGWI